MSWYAGGHGFEFGIRFPRSGQIVQPAPLAEDHEDRVGDRLAPARAILGLAGGHRKAMEFTLDRVCELLAVEPGATAFGNVWGAEIRFSRSAAVFVDQSAESISALDTVWS